MAQEIHQLGMRPGSEQANLVGEPELGNLAFEIGALDPFPDDPELDIKAFARSLYGRGDLNFNSPDHHGTPEERVEAMAAGYRLAQQGESFTQVAQRGVQHVLV